MTKWATIEEAAEYLRVSRQTIYKAINKGHALGLLFYKVDGCNYLASIDELDSYVKGGNKVQYADSSRN